MVRVNLSNIISVPALLKLAIGNIDSSLKIATIACFSLVKVKNKNDSKFMTQSLVRQMQLLSPDLSSILPRALPEPVVRVMTFPGHNIVHLIDIQTNKQTNF